MDRNLYVIISSNRDLEDGTYSKGTLQLKYTLLNGIYCLSLFSANNNIYNFSNNTSDIITTTIAAVDTDYIIPAGAYLASNITSALNTLLNPAITVTYDSITLKLTFTSAAAFDLTFSSVELQNKLGFTSLTVSSDALNTVTSTNPIELFVDKFFIVFENQSSNIAGPDNFEASFMIRNDYAAVVTENFKILYDQTIIFRNTNYLKFRFVNIYNREIDIGSNWSLLMKKIK